MMVWSCDSHVDRNQFQQFVDIFALHHESPNFVNVFKSSDPIISSNYDTFAEDGQIIATNQHPDPLVRWSIVFSGTTSNKLDFAANYWEANREGPVSITIADRKPASLSNPHSYVAALL